jgi:hypothetical protein
MLLLKAGLGGLRSTAVNTMIFWRNLGQAVPTSAGTLAGALVGYLYWNGSSPSTCQLGTSDLATKCVKVVFGTFTSFELFITACGAIGGLVAFVGAHILREMLGEVT